MIGLKTGKVIAFRREQNAVQYVSQLHVKDSSQKHMTVAAIGQDLQRPWNQMWVLSLPSLVTSKVLKVAILVGDDDSATIKKVRETVSHAVNKWSDTVHAKRSFGSRLYSLQSKHKGKLSGKVIDYLQKCFGYALKQNKDDVEQLTSSLKAIVPNALGSMNNVTSPGVATLTTRPLINTVLYHMEKICKEKP